MATLGAGDEKHNADSEQQNPEHATDVAHDVLLERAEIRSHASVDKHLQAHARGGREFSQHDGQHASDVSVGLGEGDARLETSNGLKTEVADEDILAVETHGEEQLRTAIHEAKASGKNANNFVSFAVDDETMADR